MTALLLLVLLAFAGLVVASVVWVLVRPPDWLLRTARTVFPGALFRVETDERILALTIDDGPHPSVTPGLLEELHRNGVRATFFVLGENAVAHPELLGSIRAAGHEIGNHLFTERISVALPKEEFVAELRRTDAILRPEGPPKWCRPGNGWITPPLVDLMNAQGYTPCLGTAIPLDVYTPAALTEAHFLANVRPGAILVLHDGGPDRERNIEVAARILPRLLDEGWEFLTVTELVRRGKPVLETGPEPPGQ